MCVYVCACVCVALFVMAWQVQDKLSVFRVFMCLFVGGGRREHKRR